jgi:hypothetical protein
MILPLSLIFGRLLFKKVHATLSCRLVDDNNMLVPHDHCHFLFFKEEEKKRNLGKKKTRMKKKIVNFSIPCCERPSFFWVVYLENKRFKCVDFGGVCLESWKVNYYLMHNIHVR